MAPFPWGKFFLSTTGIIGVGYLIMKGRRRSEFSIYVLHHLIPASMSSHNTHARTDIRGHVPRFAQESRCQSRRKTRSRKRHTATGRSAVERPGRTKAYMGRRLTIMTYSAGPALPPSPTPQPLLVYLPAYRNVIKLVRSNRHLFSSPPLPDPFINLDRLPLITHTAKLRSRHISITDLV
ncbi:hypothetical protein C2E23DRAFT_78466 [Lenzites betulinus]|nr:hypothetical protein C2E23DRAFT_78466 [Lenzites betulinus]